MKKLSICLISLALLSAGILTVQASKHNAEKTGRKLWCHSCDPTGTLECDVAKIAKELNVTVSTFHSKTKKEIISDFLKEFVKESNCSNPDICMQDGYIVFKCPSGKTYKTDEKLNRYGE